jgi:endonuclease/exonuclease/phosphatase family metal-dependent hydrolase
VSKPTLKILAVAGLLIVSHLLAYADSKDKPRNKKKTIEVVNLNSLHGFACDPPLPGDGDQCRVRDRIKLLLQHIAAAGCPDLVTLQENVTRAFVPRTDTGDLAGPLEDTVALIEAGLPTLAAVCGFTYEIVFDPAARRQPEPTSIGCIEPVPCRGIDEELILTRYPVLASEVLPLYSPLAPRFSRHVLYAQIAHPIGPVDVFTTHLAAGIDFGSEECGFNMLPPPLTPPACPSECVPASGNPDDTVTVRECQAKQVAAFVVEKHKVPEPAIISGDFNAAFDSPTYNEFADRGWIDSHLAAGNLECDPATGENCTAGRADDNLSDLESVDLNQTERIDFIFVVPPEAGSECPGVIQTSDRPGVTSTGLFAAEPNPFASACGPARLPICWPSDHSGNALNLSCQPSADALGHLRSETWKSVHMIEIPANRLWPKSMRWTHPWTKQLR